MSADGRERVADVGRRRLVLVDSHVGTLATLTVFFSSRFEVWSTSQLSTAFRWVFQAPADLIVLGGEHPDPNSLSFLRHARERASVRPEVLVTAARLEGWLEPPLGSLVDGVFQRPSQLLDLVERAHVLLRAPSPIGPEAFRSRARSAIEYIASHYSPLPGVRDIAQRVAVSESHLSHVFHRAVGITLKEYLTRVRIEIVKHLLVETDQSLGVIAEMVGLCDAGHLCRLFARYVGGTPGKFRRAAS
jgi:AraC-like DNA-binding protein